MKAHKKGLRLRWLTLTALICGASVIAFGQAVAPVVGHVPRVESLKPEQIVAAGKDVVLRVVELVFLVNQRLRAVRQDELKSEEVKTIAERTLETKLMALHAKKLGLDRTLDVQHRIEGLLAQALIDRELRTKSLDAFSDLDMRTYYEQHKIDSFTTPERVRVLAIAFEDEKSAARWQKRLRKATEKRFRKVVEKESLFRFAYPEGSDGGWMCRACDQSDPKLVEAAFAIAMVGDLVVAKDGNNVPWLLRLEERQSARAVPFEQVKYGIRSRLRAEREAKVRQDLVDRLSKDQQVRWQRWIDSVNIVNPPPTPTPAK